MHKGLIITLVLVGGLASQTLFSPIVEGVPVAVSPVSAANLAVASSARQQVGKTRFYDPAYSRISYPGGDVPLERGVCADVVIRALRNQQVDLQQLVHDDMKAHFSAYPQKWKLTRPDTNIDHRRVFNLETWFARHHKSQPVSDRHADYLPGDIVSWRLDNGLAHIGIVADERAGDGTPLVVHNIGSGAQLENVLFSWRIVGHYRYF